MPLQNLVDYFNDRFIREHHSSFKPFVLKDGKVNGLFGPIKINSVYHSIRRISNPTEIIGHSAKIEVSTCQNPCLDEDQIDNLLSNNEKKSTNLESIINFDRLSRTVHMLNYLTVLPLNAYLFLEVDPRHILGIKQDHGAYFEEVIKKCGLETKNVVIELSMHSQYTRYYQQLFSGLNNYRDKGYQISLKFDNLFRDKISLNLIKKLRPNYIVISARNIIEDNSKEELETLRQLQEKINAIGGQSVLQHIDYKKIDSLAREAKFDLVEGNYYRSIPFDYRANKVANILKLN